MRVPCLGCCKDSLASVLEFGLFVCLFDLVPASGVVAGLLMLKLVIFVVE